MKVIGLTGGSGCGKGAFGKALFHLGAVLIDTDDVYHSLIAGPSACTQELILHFGEDIRNENDGIDRPTLAKKVFLGNEEEKKTLSLLNKITHFHVLNEVRRQIEQKAAEGSLVVVVDAPLLFESGFDKECHTTLAVLAPYELRLKRIMERDSLTQEAAEARLRAQPPDSFYEKNAKHLIYNDGTIEDLFAKAQLFWQQNIEKSRK
ncbi:MAG: dephospho-CoA kinase [Clostridia bacterium]|nr:dephospho-CoA kinase [Clostridia bacterium]